MKKYAVQRIDNGQVIDYKELYTALQKMAIQERIGR